MGEVMVVGVKILLSVFFGGFVLIFFYLFEFLFLKPKMVRSKLEKQGLRGPSTSFLFGNIPHLKNTKLELNSSTEPSQNNIIPETEPDGVVSIAHDWPSTIFSHLIKWRDQYGPNFVYSVGSRQILCITDAEMVKKVGNYTSLDLGRPSHYTKELGPLMGQGIMSSSGPLWAYQKKIIGPEFYFDKVKSMVNIMVDSTTSMMRYWESRIKNKEGLEEIKVNEDMTSLFEDIISRACFGSSYSQGEQVISKLRTLRKKVVKRLQIGFPGLRYIPMKDNIEIWRLEKQIEAMILNVAKQRSTTSKEKDLLQMILEGCKDIDIPSCGISKDKFIVDSFKNIFIAGHETSAITASWSLMLMAAYPEWQTRVRTEVLEIFKDGILDADMLRSMKMLTMVIQETLRLYPPANFVDRNALQDIKLGNIEVEKGTNIQIVISLLHQDPNLWGPDAHKFKPERFKNGIGGACKIPQAYVPFGVGARICVGQHLAMTELKVILSLLLSKFCFTLSANYHHSPALRMLIEPENGIYLNVRSLKLE